MFCSPHSGRAYPADFLVATRLSPQAVRRSEDLFVDELFDFVPSLGAPLLVARFPRAYLDANREPYELDPKMFAGALPSHVNSGSLRVAGGLGTIPKIVAEREQIYGHKLDVEEAMDRIERLHLPFHATLSELLDETLEVFSTAVLIDCHSMPSSARNVQGGRSPDMVIGDRHGTSASSCIVSVLVSALSAQGYDVVRNKPYAGGYITERYGRPAKGVHAIQIEINRALYADEAQLLPHLGFSRVRADLAAVFEFLALRLSGEASLPAAAE
nr:N-formylglutamate amidohydrolase [Consotaella salsifontis]